MKIRNLVLTLLLLVPMAVQAADIHAADDSLSFFVIGDWGEQGGKTQRRVAAAMDSLAAKSHIDFIVTTGDNFYPAGVHGIDDPAWKTTFEEIYSLPSLSQVPWYASLGNHDYMGDIRAEMDYHQVNPRWHLPARYYSQVFGSAGGLSAEIFFIDTCGLINYYRSRPDKYHRIDAVDSERQMAWLYSGLARSRADWKIVVGHHPVYSSGWRHGDTDALKPLLPPVFGKFGVAAYFAGHDHHLEHRPGKDTQYFISGGGGGYRLVWPFGRSRFVDASAGFALVKLTRETMRVSFISPDGEQLYSVAVPSSESDEGE